MFNDQKKNCERLKVLNAEIAKVDAEIQQKSRDIYYVNNGMDNAVRNRNYTEETKLYGKAVELEKENARLCEQANQLRREKDELNTTINAAIRKLLSGSSEFKEHERGERLLQSLKKREEELVLKLRTAGMNWRTFKDAGATGHAPDRIQRYDNGVAEREAVVKSLESELKAVRVEIGGAVGMSSALLRKENAAFQELMMSES